ncbi:hypothetical protein E5Q_05079 [Mixia osmundae IAM 14324]|uniref:serine C-palmitoyltransferase n=1 Tax=Mixia osmundae (strain CBS 9802 / IAM 14324 / JCM 22182 / KY 12970) TaxID=764103 RepID=G7E6D3_MIXOS|nr:hypothetical protein E5Q_05079 [Mixia osmundae IAM 14324]
MNAAPLVEAASATMASVTQPAASQLPYPASLEPLLHWLNTTLTRAEGIYDSIPGSAIVWRYVKVSHQNDPFRTVLEILLGDRSGKHFIKFSQREIDELVNEWTPEPLMPAPPRAANGAVQSAEQAYHKPPVIIGPAILRPQVAVSSEGGQRQVLNVTTPNFAGLFADEHVKGKAIECLRSYGVGSCGPPGFYGTFDVHMQLERAIALFLGVQSSIIYSQWFSTASSVIPSFSKRGDIIVADRAVNFAIQKGIQISRSTVRYYDHNNLDSLEKVLEGIRKDDKKYNRDPTKSRRFIVTEGIFENDGALLDLPRVIELKLKYKYRLILDESWSFGVLGKTGRGLSEYYGLPAGDIDILLGSMSVGLSAAGGFCAGTIDVVNHQRINSAAFVYSAAMPPLLAVAATATIDILSNASRPHPLTGLSDNVKALRTALDKLSDIVDVPSHRESPTIHIFLRDPPTADIGQQEAILQQIADDCLAQGVLIARNQRLWLQELPSEIDRPSLRLCLSAAFNKQETQRIASVLSQCIKANLS